MRGGVPPTVTQCVSEFDGVREMVVAIGVRVGEFHAAAVALGLEIFDFSKHGFST